MNCLPQKYNYTDTINKYNTYNKIYTYINTCVCNVHIHYTNSLSLTVRKTLILIILVGTSLYILCINCIILVIAVRPYLRMVTSQYYTLSLRTANYDDLSIRPTDNNKISTTITWATATPLHRTYKNRTGNTITTTVSADVGHLAVI